MNHENENPAGDDPVDKALAHIKEAERDIEKGRELEQRGEKELREAEHELEQAKDHPHEWEIIVNARPKTVKKRVATFVQIVEIAFPGAIGEQDVVFSMTFRHAASQPHSGELAAGGTVEVKNGTIFNVTKTNKS